MNTSTLHSVPRKLTQIVCDSERLGCFRPSLGHSPWSTALFTGIAWRLSWWESFLATLQLYPVKDCFSYCSSCCFAMFRLLSASLSGGVGILRVYSREVASIERLGRVKVHCPSNTSLKCLNFVFLQKNSSIFATLRANFKITLRNKEHFIWSKPSRL